MSDEEKHVPASIEIAANTQTGKVDVLVTESEEKTDPDTGETYIQVIAELSVEPHIAREWAFRLTAASMETEEAGLPGGCDITDLELPE